MYWPIGAPKVYARFKHARSTAKVVNSDHEVEQKTDTDGPSSELEPNAAPKDDEDHATGTAVNGDRSSAKDLQYGVGEDDNIVAAKTSRNGNLFATITRSTLTVWQTKPTVALAAVVRSAQSMKAYGDSIALLMRPDAQAIVVQTELGFLVTYSLLADTNARVYDAQLPSLSRHARNNSVDGSNSYRRSSVPTIYAGSGEAGGVHEVNICFRMAIRIDAGISNALALDEDLIVATQKPAALQCIRWVSESGSSQTSTELLSRLPWMAKSSVVIEMVHDRAMNLSCWIASDGKTYAVQRQPGGSEHVENQRSLFRGFCFREPETEDDAALRVAINARFSLIAVGCANGRIDVYAVKDYVGNIPLSHKTRLSVSPSASGNLQVLVYSPDGYCLFAGYRNGWAMWSVYGKPLAHSFTTDVSHSELNHETWLHGVRDAFWIGGGCELALVGNNDDRLWMMDVAKSAATGCLLSTNITRGLLTSSTSITWYRGHHIADLTALPSDSSLWQTVPIPAAYLRHQWPIKSSAISVDSKYIAVAGRRGLAHYSVTSGRWRTFDDILAEQEFSVRGGMCWHQHFLIACLESNGRCQVRVYSRDKTLDPSRVLHIEDLAAPAILMTTCGTDSLLVYTHDNILLHYIFVPNGKSVKLVQVGQIGFHGIIRAPPRVRAISWILPEDQLEHGDPSQDVATASVLFLVDGKLVLLQPSTNEHGELKYDMRVLAQNVEYYILLRDQLNDMDALKRIGSQSAEMNGDSFSDHLGHSLRDSLWYFDGTVFHVWSDVHDILACAPTELGRDIPESVRIPIDFYPVSAMVAKGIVHGLDADLVQRRDVNFSFFRQIARTQLFLPQLLRYHLAEFNSPAALHLAGAYQHLPYFAHALEILLHNVLDSEVDSPPSPPETTLLPSVTSFLSSFPSYLDIIVNCTRKTELRSWRTLFSVLPPALRLFEQSLTQGKLKTAAGYLLVLHTFEHDSFQTHGFARLIQRAAAKHDWDLCGELARFLMGVDATGQTLHSALAEAGLRGATSDSLAVGSTISIDSAVQPGNDHSTRAQTNGVRSADRADYFSGRALG